MKVYELVREAVRKGEFSDAAYFIKNNRENGLVLPSRQTIGRWALGKNSPFYGKRLFDGKASEELSFFLGAWIGDGWADENDGGKRLLLKVRSYDFAKEFADCAAKVLGKTDSYWVRRVVDKNGKWYLVKVTSFSLFDFVNRPAESLKPEIVAFPRGFLRGIFTAEGNPSVSIERRGRPRLSLGLCITNSDLPLIALVRGMLVNLGYSLGNLKIDRKKGERTNLTIVKRDVWQFNISTRSEVVRFAKEIGFADSRKQKKLEDAISLVAALGSFDAAADWQRRYKKSSGDWTLMPPETIAAS